MDQRCFSDVKTKLRLRCQSYQPYFNVESTSRQHNNTLIANLKVYKVFTLLYKFFEWNWISKNTSANRHKSCAKWVNSFVYLEICNPCIQINVILLMLSQHFLKQRQKKRWHRVIDESTDIFTQISKLYQHPITPMPAWKFVNIGLFFGENSMSLCDAWCKRCLWYWYESISSLDVTA